MDRCQGFIQKKTIRSQGVFVVIISVLSGMSSLLAETGSGDSGDFTLDNRYTLTVNNGSGDGRYAEGAIQTVAGPVRNKLKE